MSEVLLLGHPVAHSLSPAMHNAAFRALGLAHSYAVRDVVPRDLPDILARIRAGELLGANVTVPHKRAVAGLVDDLVDDADRLGVVNTLVRVDGRLVGHNTDARGFELANREQGFIARDRVLVLGAGGAARAVVLALLRTGSVVSVAARDRAQANLLSATVRDERGATAATAEWATLDTRDYDGVVNATPLGLHGEDPLGGRELPRLVADIVPLDATPLLRRAVAQGCDVMNGLGMLLHQAVLAFRIWTGRDAPLEVMREALRSVAG